MANLLLYLAVANLLLCIAVGTLLAWGLGRIRRLEDLPIPEGPLPSVSAVVAARNEQRHIEEALRSLLRMDYPNLEVIVVDDRSTDRTGAILDALNDQCERLRVIHLTDLPEGWLGKNHALNVGAREANGELILFTDADCVMQPTVLKRAVGHMMASGTDHLPMLFRIRMPNWWLEAFVVTFSVYLMTYCRPWSCPNPRSSAHIGIGGFNLVRADVYRSIGTHEAIRMRPDDDLKFGKLVKKHGFRQECVNAAGLMYVPWYSSLRELVVGLEKNAFSGVDYSLSYAMLASTSMLLFNVFPFFALLIARGTAWWIYLCVVGILIGIGLLAAYHARLRPSCALGFPLGALAFVLIQWRTIFLNLWHGGIRWRDTHYPLSELKANRI